MHQASLQFKVQIEQWNETVLDINATCSDLGSKFFQLLGIHALCGCHTVSYPYGKGKISALNTLLTGNFPGLAHVIDEVETTHTDLMKATEPFSLFSIISLLGHQWNMPVSHSSLRRRKPPKKWLYLKHLLTSYCTSHLQVMPWKEADHEAPPDESADITHLDRSPAVAQGAPAPPQ